MTKPHNPRPVSNQEAPRESKPRAPFERIHEKPPLVERSVGREPKRAVYPEDKAAGLDRTQFKNSVRSPGALVNRRAADRLRSGYLWVYRSEERRVGVEW